MAMHEELYSVLCIGSEEDISRTLRLIRAGADVESVVCRFKDCELLLQFSAGPDARIESRPGKQLNIEPHVVVSSSGLYIGI